LPGAKAEDQNSQAAVLEAVLVVIKLSSQGVEYFFFWQEYCKFFIILQALVVARLYLCRSDGAKVNYEALGSRSDSFLAGSAFIAEAGSQL